MAIPSIRLYDVPPQGEPNGSGEEKVYGWINNQTFLTGSWNAGCGAHLLRLVSIDTLEVSALWDSCFLDVAVEPYNDNVLITVPVTLQHEPESGIYILRGATGSPERISDLQAYEAVWSDHWQVFLVNTGSESAAVLASGESVLLPFDLPSSNYVPNLADVVCDHTAQSVLVLRNFQTPMIAFAPDYTPYPIDENLHIAWHENAACLP